MFQALGILAAVLAAVSYIPYTRDIFAKKAKPERASWLIWSVLTVIAFFAQLSKGAHQSLYFNGLECLGAIVTFCLAVKYGVGGLKRRDVISLLVAAIGVVIWYLAHNAIFALLVSMGVDVIGAMLTIWKTVENPYTETYPMWLIVALGGILATISVGKLDVTLLAYPFYLFVANFAVVVAIFIGRRLQPQKGGHTT